MRPLCMVLFCAILLSRPAAADWQAHEDLPEWARRGHVYWTMAYGKITRPWVEVMAALHQDLEHGNSFDNDETRKFSEGQSIRNMQYICSRTIYWSRLFPVEPQLKDACVLNKDGTRAIMYHNPARYPGCYNNPIWIDYVKKMTKKTYDQGNVQAIFYDNAGIYHCYCPCCRKAFAEYSKAKIGRALELPEAYSPATFEGRVAMKFEGDSWAKFFHTIKDYARSLNKDLLISPNDHWAWPWHEYVIAQDVPDLVFFEEGKHPPYSMRHFGYKLALATSHGKVCGQTIYLPTEEYGRSLLPQEFALGIAEAAASDGVYIVDMNPQALLPKDVNSPVIQEGKKYYDFVKANEGLYREAQPGATLAIVYPCNSSLWRGDIVKGPTYAVAEKCRLLGIPYEIITEYDLSAEKLRPFKVVVLPEVGWLPGDTAGGLLKFAEAGGAVVISGDCGTRDEFDNSVKPSEAFAKLLGGAIIARTFHAVSDLQLKGYYAERNRVRLKGDGDEGTCSLTFDGGEGDYSIAVKYEDENDGISTAEIRADGRSLKTWRFDADDDKVHTATLDNVHLKPGQKVEVFGRSDKGEMARIYDVLIGPPASAPLEPRKVGQGLSLYAANGMQALDDQAVLKQLEALGGLDVRVLNPRPGLFANLLRAKDGGLAVHLVNYDFTYRNKGRAADRGLEAWERSADLSAENIIARKRLMVDDPGAFVSPALLIAGRARSRGQWKLAATLNGTEVAQLGPGEIGNLGAGWTRIGMDRGLLKKGENTVELRCVGKMDARHCFSLALNVLPKSANSTLSTDGGKTFSGEDISPSEEGAQTGEYAIGIGDAALTAEANPVSDLQVSLGACAAKTAALLVPGKPPETLEVRSVNGNAVVTVPKLDVYAVIKP